jgi:hypothetical protein
MIIDSHTPKGVPMAFRLPLLLPVVVLFLQPAVGQVPVTPVRESPGQSGAEDPQIVSPHQIHALDLLSHAQARQDVNLDRPSDRSKKSVGLAVLYSLALPGMGELYAGGFSSGKYFLGAEGLLWLTYAAFDIRANALQDDARSFAAAHAGLDGTGKSDQYYVDVGNFLTLADYNDKKLRDRTPELVYDPAAGYNWSWDSDANRMIFRDQRVRADNVFNNRKFVVGAVLINHLASAINAARIAIAHNKEVAGILGDLRFEASVQGGLANPHGITLTISRPF